MQLFEAETPQMRRVIGFAVGSILAALVGAGFWTAVLVGIAGALVAKLENSRNG
jgi:hypothetical protein